MKSPERQCTVAECCKKHYARGMCKKHYARYSAHGSPHTVLGAKANPVSAFWSKVDKTETCWNWTGWKDPRGYGYVRRDRKAHKVHRLSYEMAYGAVAPGLEIDHQCHNRACVNPEHLKAATRKENAENREGAEARSRSGIRGVAWNERLKFWYAHVRHNGVAHNLGRFPTAAHAERAAITKRLELFTNNVRDRRIPQNMSSLHKWHEESHPFAWGACPYEPCGLLHADFRDAWS